MPTTTISFALMKKAYLVVLNLLGYLKGIAFEILVNFGEIRENTSREKFANSLFVKINPRQNKHSDFAKVSRICTN